MDQMPGRFPPPPPPDSAAGPAASLYPLSLDRVLQLTFSLFRFRWLGFIGVTIAVMIVPLIIVTLLQVVVGEDFARAQQAQLDFAAGVSVPIEDLLPVRGVVISYLAIAVMGIAGYVALAAVITLMAGTYAGRRMPVREALTAAIRRLPSLVAIAAVVFLVIFGIVLVGGALGIGAILATAVGGRLQPGIGVFVGLVIFVATFAALIFVAVRWAFPVQAAMLERHSAMAALGRSWRLVSGSSWRVLGYTIFFALLIGIFALFIETLVTLALGGGFSQVGGQIVFEPSGFLATTLLNGLVSFALTPISTIGLTLLFFDLRWREGQPPLPESVAEQQP